ncbi:MAG: hypothetical protein R3C56_11075 [Pirellulaceae bacterium]
MVLSTRDPRRGQIVVAASLAARVAGIRAGMRLSEATALIDVDLHEHDPHEDIEALCELAEQAQQFSPLVGLEQLDKKPWAGRWLLQPECLLLDVTGIAGLFGGEPQLLDAVAGWLGKQRLFGCLGLADTVGAAWALANYRTRSPATPRDGQDSSSPDDLPACRIAIAAPASNVARRSASDSVASETHDLVQYTAEPGVLAELPLAALRLPPETLVALQRLGLHRIGQLSQLPRAGMASRLGEQLLLRWDQATGQQAEPIITRHALPDWHLEQSLEFPTQHRETMAELVRRLARQLAERLGRRGQGALRIVCRLDLVESPPLVMQLGLFRPNADAQHLEMLLTGQLDQQLPSRWAAAGAPPLWRLSLQATLTAPLVWRQTELFEAGETASRGQLARLVDTLSSRLGRKAVLSASLQRESQPELACRLQPMTGRKPDGDAQQTVRKLSSRLARARGEPARDDPQRRPTQLFSPPLPIQVTSSASACPTRFTWRGTWLEIIEATGPERLESGWWRGPSVRRDYFRVATHQAGWWWIFRDMNTGQWFLHGAFD